ncbi:MAG: carboxy terminal-processing peptidase [Opitutales bacterium]|jgi:carboxyl-terminal processing protease
MPADSLFSVLNKARLLARLIPAITCLSVSAPLALGAQDKLAAAPVAAQDDFKISRELADRFREESKLVMEYMSSRHYGDKGIEEIDPKALIETYMKDLDYAKLFYVRADVDAMNARFAPSLKSEYMGKGNLYPAFEIFRLYRERALDRLAWVFERLKKDFDFSTDQSFRPDREDIDWPANQLEADQLWEKRLTYEMLDGVINGESVDATRARLEHRYQRTERFLREIEPYDVEEMFLNSFTTSFDPHSNFFSVESTENFSIAISNSLEGIGAVLSDEDGYCVVRELMSGGPAELCGQLNPGDKIVAVAQGPEEPVDVVDMKLTKAVKLIRGPKGSEVRLTVVPADNPTERHVVRIVRDEIRLTEKLARAWLVQVPTASGADTLPVGVIDLPSFYGPGMDDDASAPSTTRDVQELLIRLKAAGAKAVVLDLRRNGGGLLSEAIQLTGLFIKDGPAVQVRYDNGKVRTDFDDDNGLVTYDGPLVVLVDRNSASASEICAGALQVLKRAVVIGDKTTHGKGTVQQTMSLNRLQLFRNPFAKDQPLGMLKITIQKFYLPDGASTQKEGVHSNIVLPSINEFLPIGESDLPNALPWDSIAPAVWLQADVIANGGARVDDALLDTLSKHSAERLASMPEFAYLNAMIDRFKKKDAQKDISINEQKRLAEREDDKAFRNHMEDWLDKMKAYDSYKRTSVLLALTEQKNAAHQEQLRDTPLPNGRVRANSYYQKVYYHQDAKGEIHPVSVESFNYESAMRRSAEVAAEMSKALGITITEGSARDLLRAFRNSDSGTDFNVERIFRQFMPDLSDAQMDALLPAFYGELVALDPDVLNDDARFDIPMREAARTAADWAEGLGK